MIWFPKKKFDFHVMEPQPGDMEGLADIHAASFRKSWSEEEIAKLAFVPGGCVWVARPHGRGGDSPAGFVLIRNAGEEAEIITIAIAPAMRRHGAARALMGHAIRELQRDRVKKLFLEVDAGNRGAVALYESLGFRQVGSRKGYYSTIGNQGHPADSGKSDALVMALDLQ